MAINNTHFQPGDYLTADRVNNILDAVKEIEDVTIEEAVKELEDELRTYIDEQVAGGMESVDYGEV